MIRHGGIWLRGLVLSCLLLVGAVALISRLGCAAAHSPVQSDEGINIVPPHTQRVAILPDGLPTQERETLCGRLQANRWTPLSVQQATPAAIRDKPLCLLGSPAANRFTADVLQSAGIEVGLESISLGGLLTFHGKDLQMVVRGKNPASPQWPALTFVHLASSNGIETVFLPVGDTKAQWVIGRNNRPIQQGRFPAVLTPAQMQQDIDALVRCIMRTHPEPYAVVPESHWEAAHQRLLGEARSGPRTRLEFFRLVAPLAASMREAHTNVAPPLEEHLGQVFPCSVRVTSAGCFVVSSRAKEIPPGARIESINDVPMARILDDLLVYLGTEQRRNAECRVAGELSWWLFMHYGWKDAYRLGLRLPDAQESAVTLTAEAVPFPYADRQDKPDLSWKLLPEKSAAVLVVNCFRAGPIFRQQLLQAFTEFHSAEVRTLVLDLRGNGGGDSLAAEELLKYIGRGRMTTFRGGAAFLPLEGGAHFAGKAYLLVGPLTNSSAADFAAVFKGAGMGEVLGEETGGTYKAFGNCLVTELPQSRLELRVSQGCYVSAYTTDNGEHGVTPDVKVEDSARDFATGRDAVLSAALDRIGSEPK